MIASVHGEVIDIALDHAVIECAGVGYKVMATPQTLATLRRGDKARVLTSMVVKEDSMTLFGFSDGADRAMFHTLQIVSGMGAKLAMAALSVMGAQELSRAIAANDTKALQTIPGVGKRMAERLALELKDKVNTPQGQPEQLTAPATATPVVEQVTEALVGLGFSDKAARPVVDKIVAATPDMQTAAVLRAALSQLGPKN